MEDILNETVKDYMGIFDKETLILSDLSPMEDGLWIEKKADGSFYLCDNGGGSVECTEWTMREVLEDAMDMAYGWQVESDDEMGSLLIDYIQYEKVK